jgi:hypothetical protein
MTADFPVFNKVWRCRAGTPWKSFRLFRQMDDKTVELHGCTADFRSRRMKYTVCVCVIHGYI